MFDRDSERRGKGKGVVEFGRRTVRDGPGPRDWRLGRTGGREGGLKDSGRTVVAVKVQKDVPKGLTRPVRVKSRGPVGDGRRRVPMVLGMRSLWEERNWWQGVDAGKPRVNNGKVPRGRVEGMCRVFG